MCDWRWGMAYPGVAAHSPQRVLREHAASPGKACTNALKPLFLRQFYAVTNPYLLNSLVGCYWLSWRLPRGQRRVETDLAAWAFLRGHQRRKHLRFNVAVPRFIRHQNSSSSAYFPLRSSCLIHFRGWRSLNPSAVTEGRKNAGAFV